VFTRVIFPSHQPDGSPVETNHAADQLGAHRTLVLQLQRRWRWRNRASGRQRERDQLVVGIRVVLVVEDCLLPARLRLLPLRIHVLRLRLLLVIWRGLYPVSPPQALSKPAQVAQQDGL